MFGYSHSSVSRPASPGAWWGAHPGHAAGPTWQPPTDVQWWSHPPLSAPASASTATHIHIWGEPPGQFMHPGSVHYPPLQPLAILPYPNHLLMPQQQSYRIETPPCPAQPKEQELVLKRIEQATDRMAQLETAIKAHQEEANQGTAVMKQYVTEQMAEWRTWKDSEEHQPTRKRSKSESAHATAHSEPILPVQALQVPSHEPGQSTLVETQTGHGTMELQLSPTIVQRLSDLETLVRNQAACGTKRRRPPSEDNPHPPKRTTRSEKAYSIPHSYHSPPNQDSQPSGPLLPQKHKAHPTHAPWKTPPAVQHSTRRRHSPVSESARPRHNTTGQEIVLSRPPSPKDEERQGQLPPLAAIDGRAINHDYPPFTLTPVWETAHSQTGGDGRPRHAVWSQLWRDKIPPATQIRIARNPFSEAWCDQWFNSLQALDWDRPYTKGKKLNRRTAWFVRGDCTCTYDYGSMQIGPRAFPEWLDDLMEVVMPECGLTDNLSWPTSCNVNYYEHQDDMVGAHADNEALFQGNAQEITIISLSLGGTRDFLVHAARQILGTITLRNGDLIAMERWTQAHLKHSIAKIPQGTLEDPRRINLTWRWIAQHKRDCAAEYQHMVTSPAALPVTDRQLAADEAEHGWSIKSE